MEQSDHRVQRGDMRQENKVRQDDMRQEGTRQEDRRQEDCSKESRKLRHIDAGDLERLLDEGTVRTLGRTDKEHPFTFFWTASGLEIEVSAREVWAEVETDCGAYELWLDVVIDGAPSQRIMLPEGRSRICLVRNLDPAIPRNILILRDTQPMPEDSASLLGITGVLIDGSLSPVPERDMRIEFIGDSITSGEGVSGAEGEMEWKPFVFNTVESYTFLTARALNADERILSQSGWGCYCSWDGDRAHALPPFYEKTCGVLTGKRNEEAGSTKPWDFRTWQPDVVVINLGTNDCAARDARALPDVESGFHRCAVSFLETIRRDNPKAQIIWAYGMLGHGFEQNILAALEAYRKKTSDTGVFFLSLPDTGKDQYGSRQHPGRKSHEAAAKVLTAYIRQLRADM